MDLNNSIDENQILKPLDPDIENENDWPDFLLTSAEVYDPSGEFESLLRAGKSNPVTVAGKLSKSRNLSPYLVKERNAQSFPVSIHVPDVDHFCYGQDNDGQAVLWAAGNAGWFQIQPSRAYKAIHKHACEAITALYFLADLYADLKGRKRKSTTIGTIFKQYAQDESHGCRNDDEAAGKFLVHRSFLLDCMAKGKENINWKNTSIYEYLQQSYDELPSDPDTDASEDQNTTAPIAKDLSDEDVRHGRAGKSKSSLRPRSGKYSLKAMGRRHDINGFGPPEPPAEAFQSPLKRKTTGGREFRPRKRATLSDEPRDVMVLSSSESDSVEEIPAGPSLPVGTKVRKHTSKPAEQRHRIQIIEEPLPSYQPQGPGDTWICTFDGCSYIVYDARKPENEDLIREHYKQHALDSQAQIDLIYQEERPYLPVNNLIKRIRDLAAHSTTSNGSEQGSTTEGAQNSSASENVKPIRRKWP